MQNHKFKLIDNTYPLEDAKEILISLLCDKIRFINQKIFSIEERFGTDTKHLKARVQELKEEKTRLKQSFKNLKNDDCEIEICCDVQLTVHEQAVKVK